MDQTGSHTAPRRGHLRVAAGTAIIGALLAVGSAAQSPAAESPGAAGSPAPFTAATIAAPGSDPLGIPYETWAARWWAWLLEAPTATNPAIEDTCDEDQRGDAVFIPQTFFGVEHAVTCTAQAGQSILVSAGGSICTLAEAETEADLAACVAGSDATIFNPTIVVDGQAIPDVPSYHVASQVFPLELPEGNLFEEPAGSTPAMGSGWFVMLSDLAPGSHTILVRDETTDEDGAVLVAELTATLVVAEPSTAMACAMALDRVPSWDETFYLSGEGFAPGTDLQLTFTEPDQTWTWGGPDGEMQPSGLRTRDDGSFGPYDITYTDPTPADLGDHVIEATDGACTASVAFTLGEP